MFLFKKIGGFLEDKLKLNGVVDLMMSGWSRSLVTVAVVAIRI